METIENGRLALLKAEESLRKLVNQAVAIGQYDSVVVLADWAKSLHELSGASESPTTAQLPTKSAPGGQPKAGRNGVAGHAKKFPKFFREGDNIVKVAWSKTSRSEYEHKAPWSVALRLVSAVIHRSAGNLLISMEQILPLTNVDGEVIPSYQAYLCLAWMRETRLVRQHGRQGYSVNAGIDLNRAVTMAWDALPTRSNT